MMMMMMKTDTKQIDRQAQTDRRVKSISRRCERSCHSFMLRQIILRIFAASWGANTF